MKLFASAKDNAIREHCEVTTLRRACDCHGGTAEEKFRLAEAEERLRVAEQAAGIVGSEIGRQWLIGFAWAVENDPVAVEGLMTGLAKRLLLQSVKPKR